MDEEKQIKRLSIALKDLNNLLGQILHIQLGIKDKRWINAIDAIEVGFGKAISWMADQKGIHTGVILDDEDINRILEA